MGEFGLAHSWELLRGAVPRRTLSTLRPAETGGSAWGGELVVARPWREKSPTMGKARAPGTELVQGLSVYY